MNVSVQGFNEINKVTITRFGNKLTLFVKNLPNSNIFNYNFDINNINLRIYSDTQVKP